MTELTYAEIAAAIGMTAEQLAERNAKACDRIAAGMRAKGCRDQSGNSARAYERAAERLRERYVKGSDGPPA